MPQCDNRTHATSSHAFVTSTEGALNEIRNSRTPQQMKIVALTPWRARSVMCFQKTPLAEDSCRDAINGEESFEGWTALSVQRHASFVAVRSALWCRHAAKWGLGRFGSGRGTRMATVCNRDKAKKTSRMIRWGLGVRACRGRAQKQGLTHLVKQGPRICLTSLRPVTCTRKTLPFRTPFYYLRTTAWVRGLRFKALSSFTLCLLHILRYTLTAMSVTNKPIVWSPII